MHFDGPILANENINNPSIDSTPYNRKFIATKSFDKDFKKIKIKDYKIDIQFSF